MFSLHPVTVTDVAAFLEGAERGDNVLGARALELLRRGDSRGPDQLGEALTTFLADRHPIFVLTEISLTNWEAQIDRGIGMMMRPPARLFIDAGMERPLAQQMSIRLDHNAGSMAGAFVPAHLVGQFDGMLEERLQRHLRRLREAELDPIANVGLTATGGGIRQVQRHRPDRGDRRGGRAGSRDAGGFCGSEPTAEGSPHAPGGGGQASEEAWSPRPDVRRAVRIERQRHRTSHPPPDDPAVLKTCSASLNFPVGNRVGRPFDLDTVRVKLLSFFRVSTLRERVLSRIVIGQDEPGTESSPARASPFSRSASATFCAW